MREVSLPLPRSSVDKPTTYRRAIARGVWRLLKEKPLGACGGAIVIVLLLSALLAPWIAPYNYDETNVRQRLKPPGSQFYLGTDNLGRDLFSRIVYGARVSVTVGFGAVSIGLSLATMVGVASGYFGGKFDVLVQRLVDAWQAFPPLVVAISVMAVLGPGLINVILLLGILGAANGSRIIRSATLSLKERSASFVRVKTTRHPLLTSNRRRRNAQSSVYSFSKLPVPTFLVPLSLPPCPGSRTMIRSVLNWYTGPPTSG